MVFTAAFTGPRFGGEMADYAGDEVSHSDYGYNPQKGNIAFHLNSMSWQLNHWAENISAGYCLASFVPSGGNGWGARMAFTSNRGFLPVTA
jgi:hypothetical protein